MCITFRRHSLCDDFSQSYEDESFSHINKKPRLSPRNILTNDLSPVTATQMADNSATRLSTIKKLHPNSKDPSNENECNEYFTDTILHNTDYQNVLVENINKMLDAPAGAYGEMDGNVVGSLENQLAVNDISLQDQLDAAIHSIVKTTEKNPIFEELIIDYVHQRNTTEIPSSTPHNSENSEGEPVNVPLKQRLRKTHVKSYAEDSVVKRSTRKKSLDVKVLSNERCQLFDVISSGSEPTKDPKVTTVPTTTSLSSAPMHQVYILNTSTGSFFTTTATASGSTINGTQSDEQFFINIPSVMMTSEQIQQMPVIFNGTETVFSHSAQQQASTESQKTTADLPIASHDDFTEVIFQPGVEPINPIDAHVKDALCLDKVNDKIVTEGKTPKQMTRTTYLKSKSLSTPRRKTSHVRVLNFNTPANFEAIVSGCQTTTAALLVNSEPTTTTGSPVITSKDLRGNWDQVHGVGTIVRQSVDIVNQQQESSDAVDFARDHDDATVIAATAPMAETPKVRKTERRSCVRALSAHTTIEENPPASTPIEDEVTNDRNTAGLSTTDVACDIAGNKLEEWIQFRSINKNNWDQHLRVATVREQRDPAKRIPVRRKKRVHIKNPSDNNSKDKRDGSGSMPVKYKARISPRLQRTTRGVTRKNAITVKLTPKMNKISPKPISHKKLVSSNPKKLVGKPRKATEVVPPKTDVTKVTPENVKLQKQNEKPSVKCTLNIASLLETPFKDETASIPPTPRFAVPTSHETPFLKQFNLTSTNSMLKCPEFPTPNFPITPCIAKTPQLGASSPKSGTGGYSNRPTDYSSGGSYYKPDESDDLDKQFDAALRTAGSQEEDMHVCDEPPSPNRSEIDATNLLDRGANQLTDKVPDNDDHNVSSSSSSSSGSDSSSSSSSSSSDGSPTVDREKQQPVDVPQVDERPTANPSITVSNSTNDKTKQANDLEATRKRMLDKLKVSSVKVQPKPKPPMSFAERKQMLESKKLTIPIVKVNVVGARGVALIGKSPSKRKIRVPSKVIYVDKLTDIELSSQKRKTERLLSDCSDNAVLDPFDGGGKSSIVLESGTNMSTTNEALKTATKLEAETLDATKSSVSKEQNVTTNVVSKREIEREIFGEPIDSDFLDTPIKPSTAAQTNRIEHRPEQQSTAHSSPKSVGVQKVTASTPTESAKVSVEQEQPIHSFSINETAPEVSNDNTGSGTESEDLYDACVLSFKSDRSRCKNEIINSVVSTTEKESDKEISLRRPMQQFRPLTMNIDGVKVKISVSDEIQLWPVMVKSLSKSRSTKEQDECPPPKVNIKYKPDCAKATLTSDKNSTESHATYSKSLTG